MASITIEVRNLEPIQAKLKKGGNIIKKQMNEAIKRAVLMVEADSKKNTPSDTSRLRGAHKTYFGNLQGKLRIEADYGIYVHEGTRPHWPPFDAIDPWAKRHGIPTFLVQRAIARKGTKAVPFLKDAVTKNKNKIEQIFKQKVTNIITQLS